jgi:hypothetical protein
MWQSYILAGLVTLAIVLVVTAESWWSLATEFGSMTFVFIMVAGLSVLGLWWLGWI